MDSAISQNRSQQFHFIMPIIIISNAHRPPSTHSFSDMQPQFDLIPSMHFFHLGRAKTHVQMAFGNALWPNGATRLASAAVTDPRLSSAQAIRDAQQLLRLIFKARIFFFHEILNLNKLLGKSRDLLSSFIVNNRIWGLIINLKQLPNELI